MKEKWSFGRQGSRGFDSESCFWIEKGNAGMPAWREALAIGNGEAGLLQSFYPKEDVLIYQNTRFVIDTDHIFEMADYSDILDEVRKNAVTRENPGVWTQKVISENKKRFGAENYVSSIAKLYHPGAQLRIRNLKLGEITAYNRYANYETGEIGGQWKDEKGQEWNVRSFASRADGLVYTQFAAPQGDSWKLNLRIDSLDEMSMESGTFESCGVREIPKVKAVYEEIFCGTREASEAKMHKEISFGEPGASLGNPEDMKSSAPGNGVSCWMLGQVGKYGSFTVVGNPKNPLVETADGGWATIILLFTDGNVTKSREGESIQVEDAGYILLAADTERFKHGLMDLQDAETQFCGLLPGRILQKISRYENVNEMEKNGKSDIPFETSQIDKLLKDTNIANLYEYAGNAHKEIHQSIFGRVKLELCMTEEEQKDRELTNEQLIAKQADTDGLNKAFLERLFDNGRYLLLSSSGYHVPRMGGMWTGSFFPLFWGNFIMDANLNLQIASMNIGNMEEAGVAYITFLLRHVADWKTNAEKLYGFKDAIKAPTHIDGDGNGQIYHSLPGWPHGYCNAITDWVLYPVYEFYCCFGNRKIPVGRNVSPEMAKEVLMLSEEDLKRIEKEGFDLVEDILAPLLNGLMNFWLQYVDSRYYFTEDGEVHLNDGHTIEEETKKAWYLFTPGYSTENSPGGIGYEAEPALAANTTMDISAVRNSMKMAERIYQESFSGKIKNRDAWKKLYDHIPAYLYTEEGAVKEWALSFLEEYDNHRHVSHVYGAWPAHEVQSDERLAKGIGKALDQRRIHTAGDDAMSHGHLHMALAEARIKRKEELELELHTLTSCGYHYSSLLTSHDKYLKSAFCTDHAITFPSILLEALVYSDETDMEVLPVIPDDWDKGCVEGIVTRCGLEINRLQWDETDIKIELTGKKKLSEVRIRSGKEWNRAVVDGREISCLYDEKQVPYLLLQINANQTYQVLLKNQ